MEKELKTIDLTCSVCGTKTGEYEVPMHPDIEAKDVTPEMVGITDIRCDEHKVEIPEQADQLPEVPQKSEAEREAEDEAYRLAHPEEFESNS